MFGKWLVFVFIIAYVGWILSTINDCTIGKNQKFSSLAGLAVKFYKKCFLGDRLILFLIILLVSFKNPGCNFVLRSGVSTCPGSKFETENWVLNRKFRL